MLFRPVRTSQPQGPARIDWSNPITRGLVIAATPSNGVLREIVSGQSTLTDSSIAGVNPKGRVRRYANQQTTFGHSQSYDVLGSLTVAALVDVNVLENYSAVISKNAGVTTSLPFEFRLSTGSGVTDSKLNLTRANASGFKTYDGFGVNAISAGEKGKFIAVTQAETINTPPVFYTAGASITGTDVGGSGSGVASSNQGSLFLGKRGDSVTYLNGAIGLTLVWNRALSPAEIKSLSANPWQIFAPDSKSLWTPAAASVSLPTLVQPNATTSAGAWTATGAATLHDAINELVPSASEYISVNSASTTELLLAEAAYPGASNQTLAYRASSTQGSTLTVTLKQGATQIMTRTHALTGTDTLYTHTLTSGEIALITAGPISVTLTTS